tara:strand:- start:98 stop:703 length:606 start_codon:yes stop_codon:yes gene_type:complete
MKVLIPENISDITLGQFQKYIEIEESGKYSEYELDTEKICIFIGLTNEQVDLISVTDRDDLLSLLNDALSKEHTFEPTFTMHDTQFGFHTNLDEITTGEYVDLMNYNSEPENLHKLMAILFRPILNKDMLGNYSIASYNGSKQWADKMKDTPLHIVNGALVFFLNLSKELRIATLRYSAHQAQAKEAKHQITGLNGDGTQQ